MAQKKKIVVANWKMNPTTLKEAQELAASIKKTAAKATNVKTIICAPFIYIPFLISRSRVEIGAQDVFYKELGSYTGEISALQLRNLGATHVIIGHSERRNLGENDNDVAEKVLKALANDLTPIVCVGEKTHDSEGAYLSIIGDQIRKALSLIKKTEIWRVILAYEPIWAIGATEAMAAHDLYQMSLFIKKILLDEYGKSAVSGVAILYGGSVDVQNAREIVVKGNVDGLLVGRESLNIEHFGELIKSVNIG